MLLIEGGGAVVLPGRGRHIKMGDTDVTVLAGAELTRHQFTLLETGEQEPGGGPPLHVHHDAAESFYVLAGAYSMHLSGRDFHCPAGSLIYVPAGMAHTFRVVEPGSRKLNLYTPAAMEGYFADLAQAIDSGVDDAGLADIAERYQMEVLGPAPEGYLNR